MESNYKITLDFQKGGYQACLEGFRAEDTARVIKVALVDGRNKKTFDNNPYVIVKFKLPEDAPLRELTTEAEVHEDVAEFTVPAKVLEYEGEVLCELAIFENEFEGEEPARLLSSAKFKLLVTDVLFNNGTIAPEYEDPVKQFAERLMNLEDEMPGKASTEYVDNKVSEETTARETEDAVTLARAKTYADEGFRAEAMLREFGDVESVDTANDYTDRAIRGEMRDRIAGDDETLESAKAYADTKQEKLTAGKNITIEDNVISAAGGGGGDIPIVTVDASQFIGENEVQLTDEQYDILTSNTFATIDASAVGMGVFGVQCGTAWSGVKYAQIITAIWDTPNILSGRFSVFEFSDNKVMTIMQNTFPTTSDVQTMIEEYVGVIENGRY